MNEIIPPPPKQPRTPKVDAIQRALRIFTLEQLEMFLDDCEAISTHGFGDVIVTFENHHPQNLEQRRSRQLPKPTNGRAE